MKGYVVLMQKILPSDIVAHAKVLEVAVVLEHVDSQVECARFPRRCWKTKSIAEVAQQGTTIGNENLRYSSAGDTYDQRVKNEVKKKNNNSQKR